MPTVSVTRDAPFETEWSERVNTTVAIALSLSAIREDRLRSHLHFASIWTRYHCYLYYASDCRGKTNTASTHSPGRHQAALLLRRRKHARPDRGQVVPPR